LVARVRAGSAAAFEVLFDRHHRPLLAFCRHMLGSSPDAEDAVQHTFMAAYSDLMRSDKRVVLRPWLYSIARHRCVSMMRARRERPVAELPEPQVDPLAAEVEAREELRAALADIAHLPEDQRAALILAELGDASHAEIAQILGCRQEKVKALVFQARSSLTSDRVARETPCDEIREQLARGGVAIRRTSLRRHVRVCTGCREFGELVQVQRRRLRALLPVAPSLGFKRAVLGATVSSGGGAASGVTALLGGLAATAVVTVTVATGGGSPASAAPAGRDAATAAITGPAWADDDRWQATAPTGPHGRQPESRTRGLRPTAGSHAAEPPSTPAAQPAPAASAPASGRHVAPDVSSEQPAEQPANGSADGEELPSSGRPEGAPEPRGEGNASSPPASPPGGGKPSSPPGGGAPGSPRGRGTPSTPPGGDPPASPPGGGTTAPPGGGGPPEPSGGKPDEPPANDGSGLPADDPRPQAAVGRSTSGV
jgi:RNA polymerase sigma factor (sigma-70 family)